MSKYPWGYPDNRVIVDGIDLTVEFQLILIDGFSLNPPQPKFYTIDIPGGNGVIDLTESLSGDVVYENREQEFTFKCIYPLDFENVKTRLSNFLHGRFFKYQLTWDPNYTYKGRFSVVSYSHIGLAAGQLGEIVVHVTADPYKYLPDKSYRINGAGGAMYRFYSGRKPVRPIITCTRPTYLTHNGETVQVGVGTFRINKFLFKEGPNDVYVNTYKITATKWQDVGRGGSKQSTWNQAKEYTWDEFQRITIQSDIVDPNPMIMPMAEFDEDNEYQLSSFVKAYTWNDINQERWADIKSRGWTWDGLNQDPVKDGDGAGSGDVTGVPDLGGAVAVITYEWGDL